MSASGDRPAARAPQIVVTLAVAADHAEPEYATRKNELYAAAVERAGGVPIRLDARTAPAERDSAFRAMDGLLFSGGADLDPARYGQAVAGAVDIEPERDLLEARAWQAATERGLPVLGICRGLQAINVFSGGTILQHVDGHQGHGWDKGPAVIHPLRLVPDSRLAEILGRPAELDVNAYHHQGIRITDLAPTLRPSAWAESSAGPLVEGLEGVAEDRFVIGIQCHPERGESTPAAFEELFRAFVAAAAARRLTTDPGTGPEA